MFISSARAVSEDEFLRGNVDVTLPSSGFLSSYIVLAAGLVVLITTVIIVVLFSRKKPTPPDEPSHLIVGGK